MAWVGDIDGYLPETGATITGVDIPAPEPATPLLVQAGAPHTAALDYTLADKAEDVAGWSAPNHMSWFWPEPAVAPLATSTARQSDQPFVMPVLSMVLQLPWYLQKGYSAIHARLWLASEFTGSNYKVRMWVLQNVDAVAASQSPRYDIAHNMSPPSGPWGRGRFAYSVADTLLVVQDPTLPANRRVSIAFQVYWDLDDDPYGTGFSWTWRIMALQLWDASPEKPDF